MKSELKQQQSRSQHDEINSLKEEHAIIKQMVIDKDKQLKTLKESHEKEMTAVRIEKKATEEALGCSKRENVAMKDKENTLIDIFKRMKSFLETNDKPIEVTSAVKCNQCEHSFASQTSLKEHIGTHKLFHCEHCDFSDNREDNVQNHMVALQTQFKCHVCKFTSNSGEELDRHLTAEHFKPKFDCNSCNNSYHTERMLKEHINRRHRQKFINCDFCGFKLTNFSELDKHISTYHRSHSSHNIRMPFHQRHSRRTYTFKEQLENGPCVNWNEGMCRYGDTCRYAHIEICKFQGSCRSPHDCSFFHYNHSNEDFLGSMEFRKVFRLNIREFPELQRHNRSVQRRR